MAALATLGLLAIWLWRGAGTSLPLRVPGTDHAPGSELGTTNPVLAGALIRGDGSPASLPGSWPQFRGPDRNGIDKTASGLARSWPATGPRELWGIDVGEGYAGPIIQDGRVYLMDYDREKKQDALRCLSLADGKELWRYAYPVSIKRNHGMSRTVPALANKTVVAMGPKCHVLALDAESGGLKWGLDLVRQFGTTIPAWYAGQCPLIDGTNVILAPGGKDALLLAADLQTGEIRWSSPNPKGWKMTHSSVMPVDLGGQRMYVYCANNGVAGVSARDGSLLWETSDWKISIATVPTPVILDEGRIFFSGGYNAGALMLQLVQQDGHFTTKTLFKTPASVFGATQHTPILYQNHLYGVRDDGKLVCLGLDGKAVWTSGSDTFGLGAFMLADGLLYAVNDSGLLRLAQASPDKYTPLAQAQVLHGRESWGPFALGGTRLLVRDLTRMICLEVGQ
jgi:outer membrane protein assembly factor BamB